MIFAQRLPAVVEQLLATGSHEKLEESFGCDDRRLIGIYYPDHRHMIVNNLGKDRRPRKNIEIRSLLWLRAGKSDGTVGPEFSE